MAPQLSEDEIDDLIYFARAGETQDLQDELSSLAGREGVSVAEIVIAAKDEGKSTCLHMASGNGHIDSVKALIGHFASRPKEEKKSYMDAPNEFGNTGLHWACLGGYLEVVKLLLENGASPALVNDKDQIPLDLALFNEKKDVSDYFLSMSGGIESGNQSGLDGAVENVELDGKEDTDKDKSGSAAQ